MQNPLPDIKTILELVAIWVSLASYSPILGIVAALLILVYCLSGEQNTPL
ncbi:MAG: hypothetical protein F6J87_26125 [Spirulina sp. SIO3F2]|nr:hypothetical protein [Spirulina sp. SIO3F2]